MAQRSKSIWEAMALSRPAMGAEGMIDLFQKTNRIEPDDMFEAGLNAALPQVPVGSRIASYAENVLPPGNVVPKVVRVKFPPNSGKLGITPLDATAVYIDADIPWGTPKSRAVLAHEFGHVADINQGHPGSMGAEMENIRDKQYSPGPHHRFFPDFGFEMGMGQSMAVQRALQEGWPKEILDPKMEQYMPWAFAGPRLATPKNPVVTNPWTYMKASTPKR